MNYFSHTLVTNTWVWWKFNHFDITMAGWCCMYKSKTGSWCLRRAIITLASHDVTRESAFVFLLWNSCCYRDLNKMFATWWTIHHHVALLSDIRVLTRRCHSLHNQCRFTDPETAVVHSCWLVYHLPCGESLIFQNTLTLTAVCVTCVWWVKSLMSCNDPSESTSVSRSLCLADTHTHVQSFTLLNARVQQVDLFTNWAAHPP